MGREEQCGGGIPHDCEFQITVRISELDASHLMDPSSSAIDAFLSSFAFGLLLLSHTELWVILRGTVLELVAVRGDMVSGYRDVECSVYEQRYVVGG